MIDLVSFISKSCFLENLHHVQAMSSKNPTKVAVEVDEEVAVEVVADTEGAVAVGMAAGAMGGAAAVSVGCNRHIDVQIIN